jgi:hypothetical protein
VSGTLRHIGLWAIAAGFSWATVILAAGPLRALRLASPFWVFWPVVSIVTAGFWFAAPVIPGAQLAALGFLAVALVIGLFTEIEGWGVSRGYAAGVSMLALVAGVGVGFGAWCREMKISPVTWLSKWVETAMTKVKELNPSMTFETETIVSQLPSGLVILGLVAIAIAVVSEGTWSRLLVGQPKSQSGNFVSRAKPWTEFRVWSTVIFGLMAVLLASFTRHEMKMVTVVGLNALNVLAVLYFFQGMAVIYKAFDHFGVGVFWRILLGFVLTFQLALIVAVIGVADYWLEFRNRLTGRPMEPKAEV